MASATSSVLAMWLRSDTARVLWPPVAAYFDATRSGTLGVHEIPVGRPAEIVNDEAFIFISWETGFTLGRDPLACPEPAATSDFLPFSSQICARENLPAFQSAEIQQPVLFLGVGEDNGMDPFD